MISGCSGWLYRQVVKPGLFRLRPDTVHTGLLRLGAVVQRVPGFGLIVRRMWSYQDVEVLGQTVDGFYFPNPVGLSAGFDKNVELVPTMQAVGFGFMTGGSVTAYPCAGNPKPWFYRLPKSKSLVVYAGLANQGLDIVLQRVRRYRATSFKNFPLVMSVAKTNNPESCSDQLAIADYVTSLRAFDREPNVRILEINISCPNTYGGEPFTTPLRLATLLAAVDKLHLTKPVWIKMPINLPWDEFWALLSVIDGRNVQGLTIGNLHKDPKHAQLVDVLPDGLKGGLSGLPTQKLSDDLIARTYKAYGQRFTIIGVGGIFSTEDAYRKICNGASLVALITGMIFEGPQLIGAINRELAELLQRDGYSNISQAVGSKNRPPENA